MSQNLMEMIEMVEMTEMVIDGMYRMDLVIHVHVSMQIFQRIWLNEILFVQNFGINHCLHSIDILIQLQLIVL